MTKNIYKTLIPKTRVYIISEKMTVAEAMEQNIMCHPDLLSSDEGFVISRDLDSTEYWFVTEEYINENFDIETK